jgi:hypothetical protein
MFRRAIVGGVPLDIEAFVREARRRLAERVLAAEGTILYRSVETLRRGDLYVLGLNPGGGPEDFGGYAVGQSLSDLPQHLSWSSTPIREVIVGKASTCRGELAAV